MSLSSRAGGAESGSNVFRGERLPPCDTLSTPWSIGNDSLWMRLIRSRVYARHIWLASLILPLQSGCGYYSFSGASIPGHLQTIAIPLAEDNSLSPLTVMDEAFTELLVDRFVRQTRLVLSEDIDEADVVLTSTISRYSNAPTAISGQERAQYNRITVTVDARYHNRVDDDMLERVFSNFEDYDPLQGGLEAEEGAALAALENIADDLFTAATSNW